MESSLKWADSEMKTKLNKIMKKKQQLFGKELNAERRDVCIILVLMLSFIASICIHSVCIIWRSYVCFVCSGYRILWCVFVVFVVEASRRFRTATLFSISSRKFNIRNIIYTTFTSLSTRLSAICSCLRDTKNGHVTFSFSHG